MSASGPDPSLVRHARRAGLVYVDTSEPGITRKGAGTGWAYYLPDGTLIADAAERDRINALAIPPAYTDVWICPDPRGHVQATGRDEKGRKQYRYHADWHAARSETKFARLPAFGRALPLLRRRTASDLETEHLSRAHVLAVVATLLDRTLLRVGGAEYAAQNKSYGLTTLRDRHARLRTGGVTFAFEGKSGQEHEVDVEDPVLAAHVMACRDVPGYHLFQYYDAAGERQQVDSADLNDYLRHAMGEAFTAKDFRTWGGTLAAATAAYAVAEAEPPDETVRRSIEAACDALGNTEAVCREYYLHPAVSEAIGDGTFRSRWSAARSGGSLGGLTRNEDALVRFVEAS